MAARLWPVARGKNVRGDIGSYATGEGRAGVGRGLWGHYLLARFEIQSVSSFVRWKAGSPWPTKCAPATVPPA